MTIKNCGWLILANIDDIEIQMYADKYMIRIDAVKDVDWVVLTTQLN